MMTTYLACKVLHTFIAFTASLVLFLQTELSKRTDKVTEAGTDEEKERNKMRQENNWEA